jgi:hypothetical protein
MGDVFGLPGFVVIKAADGMAALQQGLGDPRADETGATGDQDDGHSEILQESEIREGERRGGGEGDESVCQHP